MKPVLSHNGFFFSGTCFDVFLFFSNRLGCFGSLAVSALLTLVVIALLRACNHA
jgi:hypothetical protein